MKAQLWKENDLLYEFSLTVFPYHLAVTDVIVRKKDKEIEEHGLENWLYKRALAFPWLKEPPGKEPRTAYLFLNATLHNFKLKTDAYRVSFPDEDYISLYPVDITYQKIHKLRR